MNTNLRALIFGAAVAAALTVTFDTVTAAEKAAGAVDVVRLDAIEVRASRANFDAEGNLLVTRLAPVTVIGARLAN